ncbi:hypothetical protein GZ77_23050 [Endozoicomonas montiporae]|uniref:Pyridoxamine 5'-phosphate oxidase N-terminal domain-containing protein n=2 Tax=Endozoicomonas montiporae TaxID=1027273 RepID=A0A081N0K6_9GAMM|nr:pyridoxamine 5'-phosphate oxidase family protein [Endozoicomonas montiporae]AMO54444.1 pyridoxamine 5'-phosphate oxidase-like protein [Endozoicomonas montiporae CL-33]KEQ11979.1 hypothetical protein GZ77_23050 [Endozoicomonas montiporae]
MSNKTSASELLRENPYCVLSTCHANSPWITPLLYAYDEHWNLYWISSIKSHHSEFLSKNPNAVAIVYQEPDYGRETSALYIEGTVEICNDASSVMTALKHYSVRTESGFSNAPEDYLLDSPCRFYKLTTHKAQSLGEAQWDNNLLIDRRVEVEIP